MLNRMKKHHTYALDNDEYDDQRDSCELDERHADNHY